MTKKDLATIYYMLGRIEGLAECSEVMKEIGDCVESIDQILQKMMLEPCEVMDKILIKTEV